MRPASCDAAGPRRVVSVRLPIAREKMPSCSLRATSRARRPRRARARYRSPSGRLRAAPRDGPRFARAMGRRMPPAGALSSGWKRAPISNLQSPISNLQSPISKKEIHRRVGGQVGNARATTLGPAARRARIVQARGGQRARRARRSVAIPSRARCPPRAPCPPTTSMKARAHRLRVLAELLLDISSMVIILA